MLENADNCMPELSDMDDHYKNRWYDKYPELRKFIDDLKNMEKGERETIILDMQRMIMEYDNELIDRHVHEFPMTYRRRWYDKDPYSWLVINALEYVDDDLLTDIILYLKEIL